MAKWPFVKIIYFQVEIKGHITQKKTHSGYLIDQSNLGLN